MNKPIVTKADVLAARTLEMRVRTDPRSSNADKTEAKEARKVLEGALLTQRQSARNSS